MEVFGIVCTADLQEQWQDVHPAGHMSGAAPHAHRRERPLAPAWEVCRQAAPHAEKVSSCLLWSLLFFYLGVWACCVGKVLTVKVILIISGLFCWFRRLKLKNYSSGVHFVFSPNFVIFYLPFFCHFLYTCSVLFSSIFFISTLPHPHCKVRKKEKRGGGGGVYWNDLGYLSKPTLSCCCFFRGQFVIQHTWKPCWSLTHGASRKRKIRVWNFGPWRWKLEPTPF